MKPGVFVRLAIAVATAATFAWVGCKDDVTGTKPDPTSAGLLSVAKKGGVLENARSVSTMQVDLVADNGSFPGARVDPKLLNGWGIAVTTTGIFWISSNGAGLDRRR